MTVTIDNDLQWMSVALAQAKLAQALGEVPIGAALVANNQLLAVGHNRVITDHDPSAHAEVVALRAGGQALQNYRLGECVLYVTLEPCAMCAAALVHSRVRKVVYAAVDERQGAAGSVCNLLHAPFMNHRPQVVGGVLAAECQLLLQQFFAAKRK